MTEKPVKDYYTGRVREEWARLTQDAYHRLELETTLRFLESHLPQNGHILDAGGGPGRYTVELAKRGYFFLPKELERAFRSHGVDILEMVGLEGLGAHHAEQVNELANHEERWQIWLETHYQTCTHPSVVGMSEHMLLVGRKR
jgi:SAM-dependent methyltransferase